MLPLIIPGVIVLLLIMMSVKVVEERNAKIVQRLGKFNRILNPGINFVLPFLDSIAGKINLKIQQMDVTVETKTKDNVFVKLQISVQVQVMKSKIKESFYELEDPYSQISSYIFDVVRAEVPKLDLDDVFARKDDIADAVKIELSEHMDQYGYQIVKTLITDIDPDPLVKESMNRINAARRNKEALLEDAEGRKQAKIKDAEADKESKRLQGEGVAKQRLAIIDGFAESVKDFQSTLSGVSSSEIMQFVLMTQHYDTIKDIGEKNSAILVPYSPNAMNNVQQQLVEGYVIGNEISKVNLESKEEINMSKQRKVADNPLDYSRKSFEEREKHMLDIDDNIEESF
ncbi:MAG: SPFH domain-containing protein [Saprospiraceae bacterium]|nr:SPFH domain-containing protein [Saprospiraceae bacterium]